MYATQAPVLSNLSIGDSAKIIKKNGETTKKQRKEGKKKIKKQSCNRFVQLTSTLQQKKTALHHT